MTNVDSIYAGPLYIVRSTLVIFWGRSILGDQYMAQVQAKYAKVTSQTGEYLRHLFDKSTLYVCN